MSHVICFANQKGGVGKTASSTNVSACLGSLGFKVLLIDMDPQANASLSLGIREPVENSIYEVLQGKTRIIPVTVTNNVDLVPSKLDLAGAEYELINQMGREHLLKVELDLIKDKYDYVVIDCHPSIGLLTINALAASDFVFVPLEPEFLALAGLASLEIAINRVKKHINPKLIFGGIVITKYDQRKNLHGDVIKAAQKRFKEKVLTSMIRTNSSLAEATTAGKSILEYAPKSNGAIDYLNLAKEIKNNTSNIGKPGNISKPSNTSNASC